jgi:co-chaperonin GroES (HSP10)
MNNSLSFYTEEESKIFEKNIKDALGFAPPRACGWLLYLKIYTAPKTKIIKDKDGNPVIGANGKPMVIEMPDSIVEDSRWGSAVGLVCSRGPLSYKAERFKGIEWCRVGDWVIYPQHRGTNLLYKDTPFLIINDDDILGVIENPEDVRKN